MLAFDLGAESGRLLAGRFDGDRVELREVHRFGNVPRAREDGIHWDVHRIFAEMMHGLRTARRAGLRPWSIGIDSWGVDFALITAGGRLVELPRHYRDSRTEGMVDKALARVSAESIYQRTGTQFLPMNTLFQLLAMEGSPHLDAADRMLLIPDLLCFWLAGAKHAELTNASTTQLFDVSLRDWAFELIDRLGLPGHLLPPIVTPGTDLGPVMSSVTESTGLSDTRVTAVASHDTGSAVVGTPLEGRDTAYVSSGTWSLVGFELDSPVLSREAREANISNELGFAGTVRLLRNVMGLWLLQETRRAWGRAGAVESYSELERAANGAAPGGPLIDPDLPEFVHPGDMPARIAAACVRTGQRAPAGRPELVRCIFESLACKTRLVLEQLERVSGRRADSVHIVGGGAKSETLSRLIANVTGRRVEAGPIEATGLGNVLVQLHAAGHLNGLTELREVARHSLPPRSIDPDSDRARWEDLYGRFRELTARDVRTAPA